MGTRSLDEYMNSLPNGDYDEVNQSIRKGFQRKPEVYAAALQRARDTGVAPDLQEGIEQDIDLEARVKHVPIGEIVGKHPALAKHLKNEEFATLAQNDLRSLMGLSTAVQAIPEMKPWTPTAGDTIKQFFRSMMEGTLLSSEEEAQAIRQAESSRIRAASQMGISPTEMHTGSASALPAGRIGAGIVRGTLRPLSGAVRYAERKTGIDSGVGSALQGGVEALTPISPTVGDVSVESFSSTLGLLVPGLGMQKAVGMVQKIPALAKMPAVMQKAGQWAGALAMAVPEAASEAQDTYDTLVESGADAQQASRTADKVFLSNAALLAVTDKIGWFSGDNIIRRMASEGIQEGGQAGIGNVATDRPVLENVPEAALMGAGTAGVIDVGRKFLSGLLGRKITGAIDFGSRAQDAQEFVTDLSEGVKAAKIAQMAPEKIQEFIQDASRGGQESILIPAERYFQTVQDSGMNPVDLANNLGVTNLEEAMKAGTDVVIPTGAYAAQIAATDLHAKLAPDLRLNIGDMTQREMEEAAKLAEEEIKKVSEEAQTQQAQEALADLPMPEIEKFQAKRQAQLEAAGYALSTAAEQARFHAQVFETLAGAEGLTVEQMDQMFPLDISGMRAGEAKKSIAQIALDRLKMFGEGAKEYFQGLAQETRQPKIREEVRNVEPITGESATGPQGIAGVESQRTSQLPTSKEDRAAGEDRLRNARNERIQTALGNPESIRPSSAQFSPGKIDSPSKVMLQASSTLEDIKATERAVPIDGTTQDGYRFTSDANDVIVDGPNGEHLNVSLHPHRGVMVIDAVIVPEGKRGQGLSKKLYRRAAQVIGHAYPEIRWVAGNSISKESKALRESYPGTIRDGDDFVTPIFDLMEGYSRKEAKTLFQGGNDQELQAGDILSDKRGFIQVTPGRQFHIGLLEGRDLSTFLHESGHYFLEVMGDLAERPEASDRIKSMWGDTLKSFGVESRDQIETKHHEQFARQFEVYMFEGKAPSEKLKPMFQRFKAWLMLVYRQLDKIGARLNDDVRSVFDRMLATDAEIEDNRPQTETFSTAEDMGVTQAEFDIYRKAQAGAIEEGKERLLSEALKDVAREQKKAYKEEREAVRAEVEAGVNSRPDVQALAAILDPTSSVKLNLQSVIDQFGDARGIPTVEQGGMDLESAAEILGWESGSKLYQALRDTPNPAELTKTLTDEIMLSRYGDVLLDGTIADKAVDALHNDRVADVIAMELRAMNRLRNVAEKVVRSKERQDKAEQKAADAQIPTMASFREQAKAMVDGMSLRMMQPNAYRVAQEKASREAFKLKGKKDYAGAVAAKTREMLNHFLYLEAKKAQEEGEKIYRYARSLEGKTAQGKLGKAGKTFQDQVNSLLDRFQFARETNRALEDRQSLLEFVREQEANGEAVLIDPGLLDELRRVNYREVPMTELRAIKDALKNIQTIAYRQLEMDIDGKKVSKEEAKAEMIRSALENFEAKPLPFSGSELTAFEKAGKWLRGKSAMFTKLERMIDWLDGGKIEGPWRRFIFDRIAKAEIDEFDLNTAVTQKFINAFEKMDPKHRLSMMDSVGVTLPGMDRPLNRRQAITLLLNMGNDQNQEKLMEGYGWTSPEDLGLVGDALGNLTPSDLEFVNTTWNTINALWPSIEALEFKMTGIAPEKVEARPFVVTLKDGTQHRMEGGYFPIVYDPSRSPQGAKQIEGNVNELTDKGFTRPNTPHGFTKSRVQFSAPILLNFEHTLTRHISQVIKDVTHREAVTDIYSLITSQDIRTTLNETVGEAAQKQFLPWLKSVVNDRNGSGVQGLEEFSGGLMALRSNLITATLAFRLSSVIVQATDLVRAMDRVKPIHMASALASFVSAQRLGHNELVDEMREKSGEMRHRPQSFDRDMRVVLQKGFGDESLKKRVAEFGAHGLSYADAITSTITWVGAYRQALADGADEAGAIAEADRTVRLVLQAGSPKDLTPIQKGDALAKLLTMYAGDSFATYGIMQDAAQQVKGAKDTPRWAARMLFAVLMPAILADFIKGRIPEDDEDKAKWLAWKAAMAFPNTMPILRDISAQLESGYDYKFTPVAAAIDKAGKALASTSKLLQGEKDPVDWTFQGIDAAGTLLGVPGTSQIMQTSRYLYKVYKGEENPETMFELTKNAVLGKPK